MDQSFLAVYICLYVLVIVAVWVYFFIYSYKNHVRRPWGFIVVIAGLFASRYGFPFYVGQVILIHIQFVFLVSLLGIFLNITDVRKKFYLQNRGGFFLFLGVGLILGFLLGFSIRTITGFEDLSNYPDYAPIAIAGIVIQISIAEEILHRGLFLSYLTRYGFRPMYAIMFQSLIFAAGHAPAYDGHLVALGNVFLVGLATNYLAWKNNNLIAPIVLHLTGNLLGIVWWFITTS